MSTYLVSRPDLAWDIKLLILVESDWIAICAVD
jgi:hypothetical protein